jgi:glycosyltransferase involved in cell wall biosynthesis
MKSLALKRAKNIYISRTVAAHVGLPGAIIPNPYDDATFRPFADIPRDLDLVFVGRLVSDKGVDILLHALAKLRSRGVKPNATIIGTGSEETGLRDMTRRLELTEQVVFAGTQRGNDLSRMIARHRIMVVPSRWAEPFGVVALEGIACGCAVVGSNEGGLPEAIGPCGVTFPNGSADSLADAIDGLLRDARQLAAMREAATAHLAKHAPDAIARLYLEAFLKARPACRP